MSTTNSTYSAYPQKIDQYTIPLHPEATFLSQAEASSDQGNSNALNPYNHPQMHEAVNQSITNLEENTLIDNSSTSHDHSDPWNVDYSSNSYKNNPLSKKGRQLLIQNTHVTSDTHNTPTVQEAGSPDSTASAWHHTVSTDNSQVGAYQAVSGTIWNSLGLNTLPEDYFTDSSSINDLTGSTLSEQLTHLATAANDTTANTQLLTEIKSALLDVRTILTNYGTWHNTIFNLFQTAYFLPSGNITLTEDDGQSGSNQLDFGVGVRLFMPHFQSIISNLTATTDQDTLIFTQSGTETSSNYRWRPTVDIVFPNMVTMINDGVKYAKNLIWKTDGNMYISSLGAAGEFDVIINSATHFPDGMPSMICVDASNNDVEVPNILPMNPFDTADQLFTNYTWGANNS